MRLAIREAGALSHPARIVTVEIAGLRVCYAEDDFPLAHMLTDPRARIVHDARPLAPDRDIDLPAYGGSRGGDPVHAIMAHLWLRDIPFAYLDIGANVGLTMVAAASFMLRCGRRTPIYGFEPGDAFTSLTHSMRANGIEEWARVFNLALSDRPGRLDLHQIEHNSSAGSLLREIASRAGHSAMSHRPVEVTTIDAFVAREGIATNLVAKIDTEGADLKVIWGARGTVSQVLTPMILEFTPSLIQTYCDPAEELERLSADLVFLDERRRGDAIRDFRSFVGSIDTYTDLIALPRRLPDLDGLMRRLSVK